MAVRLSRIRLSAASGLAVEASIAFIACDIGVYADDALAEHPWPSLLALSADLPADVRESQSTGLLPAGVRTLSVETDLIMIACAHMPSTLKPQAVCAADAVQKLCELFGTAPDSYRKFRLSPRSQRAISIGLAWNSADIDVPYFKSSIFRDMALLAGALEGYAAAYGVIVELSADQCCCVISRPA